MGQTITEGRCHCGAVHWRFKGEIPDATVCNCTICRRTGALWAYDFVDEAIHVSAPPDGLTFYIWGSRSLAYEFCATCKNLVSWRATAPGKDGRTRIAVNLRLADPKEVAHIPLLLFDGLQTFEDLPPDGRKVSDLMF